MGFLIEARVYAYSGIRPKKANPIPTIDQARNDLHVISKPDSGQHASPHDMLTINMD